MRELLDELERRGVAWERTNGGHVRVWAPAGPVFIASTPSDWRAVRNDRARLRRAGALPPA